MRLILYSEELIVKAPVRVIVSKEDRELHLIPVDSGREIVLSRGGRSTSVAYAIEQIFYENATIIEKKKEEEDQWGSFYQSKITLEDKGWVLYVNSWDYGNYFGTIYKLYFSDGAVVERKFDRFMPFVLRNIELIKQLANKQI